MNYFLDLDMYTPDNNDTISQTLIFTSALGAGLKVIINPLRNTIANHKEPFCTLFKLSTNSPTSNRSLFFCKY